MKGSLKKDLKEIETLIIQGKYPLAHERLDHYLEKENISTEDYISCKILRGKMYYISHPYSLALEDGLEALEKSKKIGNNYLIFDSATLLLWIYRVTGEIEKVYEVRDTFEQALNSIEDKQSVEYLRRKSIYLRIIKSHGAGFEAILNNLNQSFEIAKQINYDREICRNLAYLGNLYSFFDKKTEGLRYYEQSLAVAERTGDIEMILISKFHMSDIYMIRGELDKAYQLASKCLSLAEEMNSLFLIGNLLCKIALYHWHKGDVESAYNYYEQSKKSFERATITKHWNYSEVLYQLVMVSLEMGNLEGALELRDKLEMNKDLYEEVDLSHGMFKITEAIIIKYKLTKGIEHDLDKRLEAEQILEDLSFTKYSRANVNKKALFHLCDLYVQEYYLSQDTFVFEKLKSTVSRFAKLAEDQQSSILLAEVLLFESQLALIDSNTNKARTLLNKAQFIADEKGIHKLGTLISNTHDNLVDQLDIWESTANQLPDIIDRMELTCLEDLLNKFVRNKIAYEDIILENENPSLFLIINKDGSILYTENFESSYLSETLISELAETIIQHVNTEKDSDSFVERAKVNGYNVIFQELDGIRLCYAFIGKSYSAISKFRVIIQEFHDSINIWSNLKEKILNIQSFEMSDRVHLSTYLQNIFS